MVNSVMPLASFSRLSPSISNRNLSGPPPAHRPLVQESNLNDIPCVLQEGGEQRDAAGVVQQALPSISSRSLSGSPPAHVLLRHGP